MQLVPAVRPPMSDAVARLEELGRIPLVRFDYVPYPGGSPRPPKLRLEPGAFPTWDAATRAAIEEQGWDAFWSQRPAGAGRLVPLGASSYDDAVRAVRALVASSKPGSADGDKQAHAVLQAADGAWYATGLGAIVETPDGLRGVRLQKLGPYLQYQRPTVTALVPELRAVVGGVSVIDLRPKG